jgi:hypothetical protein
VSLRLAPYIEKVVPDYLRATPEVVEITGRIVTKTPDSTGEPWVRVTKIDGQPTPGDVADHLIAFYLQLDCYASATGGLPEASRLARTVRAAIAALNEPGVSVSGAVVTGAKVIGDTRVPDTDLEPARERVILTVVVWAHP